MIRLLLLGWFCLLFSSVVTDKGFREEEWAWHKETQVPLLECSEFVTKLYSNGDRSWKFHN